MLKTIWLSQIYIAQKVRQVKLSQNKSISDLMNQLFTFSSQQFEMVIPALPPHSIRKKMITNFVIKRQCSLKSDSTVPSLRQRKDIRKYSFKRVAFGLAPLTEPRKQNFQDEDYLEENLQNLNKSVQSRSKRYLVEIENKKSLELQRQSCFDGKIIQTKKSSIAEADHCIRKQRRLKSLRLAPKLLIPLSDRKLPKVFKILSNDIILPRLSAQKQVTKRLRESRQKRETFSAQRARVKLNYDGQMVKINKRRFLEDQRLASMQRS